MTILLVVLGAAGILTLWLMWMEPRMTYYPSRRLDAAPSGRGWSHREVQLRIDDGLALHGWHLPRAPGATGVRLAVLFLHGNAGNISHRFEKLAILRDLGVEVLIFDYRGYGRSEGRPGETGLYRDARAAYAHLVAEGLAPRQILLYGESLGAAVAVQLATEVEVGGMVLEEAFTSVADVAQAMFPFLPVRWWLRHRYDSLGKIGRIAAPILLLHSRDDEYFPLRHAERLAAAAGSQARLVALRGGHNDAFLMSEPICRRALADLFAQVGERAGANR